MVGADVHERAEELKQPEEDRQLHAVPAKAQGKTNADQILDLKSKLVIQKVAAKSSLDKVKKSITNLQKDLRAGP